MGNRFWKPGHGQNGQPVDQTLELARATPKRWTWLPVRPDCWTTRWIGFVNTGRQLSTVTTAIRSSNRVAPTSIWGSNARGSCRSTLGFAIPTSKNQPGFIHGPR
jgi:hypothetical protein